MTAMKSNAFLAVDIGATSGRTILAFYCDNKLEMRELSRFSNPMVPIGGHLFWDIVHLYNEILKSLKLLSEKGITIASIGIDTWGCDFAFFGKDGQVLGMPYCYRDGHTSGARHRFFERMPADELYRRTGIQFMDFNSVFQLDTLKRNGCDALDKADKILFIPDALIYMLTGKAVCEYTVASTSQLLDSLTGEFDTEVLRVLGIGRERFGTMVKPGELVGPLTQQVQDHTSVGLVNVVAVAGHDTASAVAAVPAEDKDYAYLSCGTWSLLGVEVPEAIITEESLEYNFTNEGGVDGTIRFLKNICGLWLFEQSRKEFEDAPSDVADLVALCEASTFDGLINPDSPRFVNPLSMLKAIRDYCIDTGQPVPETPADYCRCIFRSLAFRYRQVMEQMKGICDVSIKKLHVIGGGSQNSYLMQYAANALNMPVICGPVEGTALGNVLMQIKASGLVSSLSQMREIAANSVAPVKYLPKDVDLWEKEYQRYVAVTSHE